MCGRFASYKHHEKLNKIFDLKNKAEKQFKSYNVTPGQNINIILNYDYYNYILESNWGYNFVNKTTNQNQKVINSRIETINEKLLFKDLSQEENVSFQLMDTMNGKITVIKKNHILFNSVMES